MKLEGWHHEDVLIVKLRGELDSDITPRFGERMDGIIASGDHQIVFDLEHLAFIGSAALGHMIKVSKRLQENGGDMVFARPSRFVRECIANLGLHGVFRVFEDVEDAVAHFRSD